MGIIKYETKDLPTILSLQDGHLCERRGFLTGVVLTVATGLMLALSTPAFAMGGGGGGPAPKPKISNHTGSDGANTLTLRPDFSISTISDGGGEGILRLDRHATDASRRGTVNLDEFRGFSKLYVEDYAKWTITGGSVKTEGVFDRMYIGGTLRLSNANFGIRSRSSLQVARDASLEITGTSKLKGSLKNDGDIRFMSKGEGDSLTIDGDYRGSGDVFFYIDGSMNDQNKVSLKWDKDKLIIRKRIRGIARRKVVIVTPEGEKDVSLLMDESKSPVLIEVHGRARANAFEGSQDIGDAHHFEIKHKNGIATDTNGEKYNTHQWYFVHKEETSTVKTTKEVTKTMSDSIESELVALGDQRGENPVGVPSFQADVRRHKGGPWARQQSFRTSRELVGVVGSRSGTQSNRVHFGYDVPPVNFMGGDMVVGAVMSQGFSASDVSSTTGNGDTNLESHAAALTASWGSPDGFYAGGQTGYARFSNDISVGNRALVSDNKGTGVSASVNAGYRFGVPVGGMDFSIAPQMRLVWSRVDFDDFIGLQGGLISLEDGDRVTGRLGLSWNGEWQDIGGSGRIHGGVSLRDALDGRTAVNVSGVSFAIKQGLSVDGRLGVSYEWDEGYAVHGEAIALRGDAEEVRASLDVRIDF